MTFDWEPQTPAGVDVTPTGRGTDARLERNDRVGADERKAARRQRRERREMTSAHREAIRTARSVVVKVGTTALTTPSGVFDAGRLATLGRRDRGPHEGRLRRGDRVVGCDRRGHRTAAAVQAARRSGHQAGSGQRRTGRAGQCVERGVRPLPAHRRPGAADRTRHLDAGAAHQRPAHAGPAARAACGRDRQRERHRRHQRDPVRRQRPALGAGRPSGRGRRAGAAVRHRRPLRLRSAERQTRASSPRSTARRTSTAWWPAGAVTWVPAGWRRSCRRRCWPPTRACRCCWPRRRMPLPRSPTRRSARCSRRGPNACRRAGSGSATPPSRRAR